MKNSLKFKNVLVALAVACTSIALPTSATAIGSVNVVPNKTSVAPFDSVQFTVDPGNGEYMGALFSESGTGWSLFDVGYVKDLPAISWSLFSPACDSSTNVIYRVYTTLMVDSDPDNPPLYGDLATAGLVAGQSVPVEFLGANCANTVPPVILSDSTTVSAVAGTLPVVTIGANKSVTWSVTGGANAALFEINSAGLISFRSAPSVGSYTVIITATDTSGNTTTETFTVVVSPAPVAPQPVVVPEIVITGPAAPTFKAGELAVGNYTADRDAKLAISGGVDAQLFELSATGVLSFKQAPKAGTYTVVLTATDPAGNTSLKTVIVTVPDLAAPVITTSTFSPSITSGESQAGLFAADKEVDWSISGGADAALFRINRSGELSITRTAKPGVFTVVIKATDRAGNSSTKTVTLTVLERRPQVIATPTPSPTAQVRDVSRVFSGFALARSTVTKSMQRSIERFVRANPNYARVTVTGYTQGPTVLWSDKYLAVARAMAVSAVIKRINPKARITIDSKTELAVGSNIRRAKVVLSFK